MSHVKQNFKKVSDGAAPVMQEKRTPIMNTKTCSKKDANKK